MSIFKDYAKYYNLFYRDKDYAKEVDYVDSLIKRYAKNKKRSILDVGCGTGIHALLFRRKGYRVVGIDKSTEMVNIAKSSVTENDNIEFYTRDSTGFNLDRKFDIVVSLFHVISYHTTNEAFYRCFGNIYKHLNKGGVFIFDFWYGPAVLTQKPQVKVKKFWGRDTKITRTAIPRININENTVDINYEIIIKNKGSEILEKIEEKHKMRYFFLPELNFMLGQVGFKVIKSLKWMSFKEGLSAKSWNGALIANKE